MRLSGFVGPTYESMSLTADAQKTLNLYPEPIQSGTGKSRYAFHGTPGLSVWGTMPASPIRGMLGIEGKLYVVAGSTLYDVSSGGTATSLGGVGSGTDIARIILNSNNILVIAGGQAHCWDGATMTNVISTGYALDGTFMDGYYIAIDWGADGDPAQDSRRFRHSNLLDGTIWGALDFAAKLGAPDSLVAMARDHNDLWLFGTQTIEIWRQNYSTAPSAFPWERDPGAFIQMGIIARRSHAQVAGMMMWLAGDPQGAPIAVRARGYQYERVSTHAVEQAWATYSEVTDAESYTYSDRGHDFWVINFPTANKTWVYDASINLWHERGGWDGTVTTRHRGRVHQYAFGKHLVGDYASGKIYEMDQDIYTDDGTAIARVRRAPHLSEEEHNIFHHRLQLDMEVGLASNPVIGLRWSNDGGKTYGTAVTKTAGAAGDYKARVIWRRLGKARDRVYEFSSTASMRHAWVDAYINATPGEH